LVLSAGHIPLAFTPFSKANNFKHHFHKPTASQGDI
jgi:hypothetical protein